MTLPVDLARDVGHDLCRKLEEVLGGEEKELRRREVCPGRPREDEALREPKKEDGARGGERQRRGGRGSADGRRAAPPQARRENGSGLRRSSPVYVSFEKENRIFPQRAWRSRARPRERVTVTLRTTTVDSAIRKPAAFTAQPMAWSSARTCVNAAKPPIAS